MSIPNHPVQDGVVKIVGGEGVSMGPEFGRGVWFQVDPRAVWPRLGCAMVFPESIHRVVGLDPLGGVWEMGDAPRCRPRRRRWSEIEGLVVAYSVDGPWHPMLADWRVVARAQPRIAQTMARGLLRRGRRFLSRYF